MAWIRGTRRRKEKRIQSGTYPYTLAVLRRMKRLSNNKKKYERMIQLLRAKNVSAYLAVYDSPGLITSKEAAVKAIAFFLDSSIRESQTRRRGRRYFVNKVRRNLEGIARDVSYKGKTDAIASSIIRKSDRVLGWRKV
ncbi:MAG: hypothetical protein ACE5J7_01955 [Candidatus Aenigmatarchaeota archaeon]